MKKKEKLLRHMSDIDEKYVAEADPARGARPRRARIYKWSAIAACFCLLTVGLSLWLFLPFRDETPDVSQHEESEYYEIIQKLKEVTYTPATYQNNFELFISNLFSFGGQEEVDAEPDAPTVNEEVMEDGTGIGSSSSVTDTGEYVEVTDNQVAGVIEGDLFKRTRDRVFYLRSDTLSVYSIEGEDTKMLGSYEITPFFEEKGFYSYQAGEIYLSEDGTVVTLVIPYEVSNLGAQVGVLSLDVTDPAKIQQKSVLRISGGYLSSRSTEGKLLLMSEFAVGRNPDFSKEENFIPQIKTEDGQYSIPAKDILCPDKLTNSRYTVICELDPATLTLEGCTALLSYSQEIYVSAESIYVTRQFRRTETDDQMTTEKQMTEITRLFFGGEGFEHKGSVTVEGSILNQYSMDEYEGYLRAVTTTEAYQTQKVSRANGKNIVEMYDVAVNGTNANLYVIDLATMTVYRSVERFAPEGERVQSVRFDKTAAYVCTSVVLSDPVFFFDLSDPENITWKDTGTIEGFSSSLVNFGDGYLLGIGRGDSWNSVKIEVYEETEDGVRSVATYKVAQASYSTDYKSYLIDREQGLLGLAICDYDYEGIYPTQNSYVLLQFNGYDLYELLVLPTSSELASARAFVEDGYLYLFHSYGFEVEAMP